MEYLRVTAVNFKTEDLFEVVLEAGDVTFEPGNCVAIFSAEDESRPYSISSGIDEDVLRFLVRSVPDGSVSRWLAQRKPGDEVRVSAPFGWFRPGHAAPGQDSVFIATGTGIAPFLSYLRSAPERPPLACLYGVSLADEAFALDELEALPNFQLAVSREVADRAFYGRVTGQLESLPLRSNIQFYLCGLDVMIDEVSGWLEQHSIDYTQIHREVFFYADET
ncbi:MAG: FAD-binding oxidoreductase [Deltaproteobacteria bacterium]|jgi:ferredoxin-NADP reductase|nr:FAD-binding oxidoreductase [Deltaproteobacteria bacterium]MCW8893730.1 FAD-binding oxidoreductase [Deltaproteobacteria bacterium]MCW9049646.1 FAD-binding oxidoreductase [Deltaproteobacteria bacterium]